MTIKEFFNNLGREIKSTRNSRTLIFYKRKAQNYKEQFNNLHIDRRVKKLVNREYKKIVKLIKIQKRKIR